MRFSTSVRIGVLPARTHARSPESHRHHTPAWVRATTLSTTVINTPIAATAVMTLQPQSAANWQCQQSRDVEDEGCGWGRAKGGQPQAPANAVTELVGQQGQDQDHTTASPQ